MGRRRMPGELTQKDKDQLEILDGATRVVETMTVSSLAVCPEYQNALKVREAVIQVRLKLDIASPDSLWWNWWNQIDRSTLSIVGNIAESIGRGRGHAISACLIARGELFETLSLISGKGCPPEASEALRDLIPQLIQEVDLRLRGICQSMRMEVEGKRARRAEDGEPAT